MTTTRSKARLSKQVDAEVPMVFTIQNNPRPQTELSLPLKKEFKPATRSFSSSYDKDVLRQNIKLYLLRSIMTKLVLRYYSITFKKLNHLHKWKYLKNFHEEKGFARENDLFMVYVRELRKNKNLRNISFHNTEIAKKYFQIAKKSNPQLQNSISYPRSSINSLLTFYKFCKYHPKLERIWIDTTSLNDDIIPKVWLRFRRTVNLLNNLKHFYIKVDFLPLDLMKSLQKRNLIETLFIECSKLESKEDTIDIIKNMASKLFLKHVRFHHGHRKYDIDCKFLFFELLNYPNLKTIDTYYELDRSNTAREFDYRSNLMCCGDVSDYYRDVELGNVELSFESVKWITYKRANELERISNFFFIWQENYMSENEFQQFSKNFTKLNRLDYLKFYSKDILSKKSLEIFFKAISSIHLSQFGLDIKATEKNVDAFLLMPYCANNIRLFLSECTTEIAESVMTNLGRETSQNTNKFKIFFKSGPIYLRNIIRVFEDEEKIFADKLSLAFYEPEDPEHISQFVKAFRKRYTNTKNYLYFEIPYKEIPKKLDLDIGGGHLFLDKFDSFYKYNTSENKWELQKHKMVIHKFEDENKAAIIYKQFRNIKNLKKKKTSSDPRPLKITARIENNDEEPSEGEESN